MTAKERLDQELERLIPQGLIVAFSGGVDSACLLWAAREIQKSKGGRLLAITAASESVPARDLEDARGFAERLGVEHRIIRSRETSNPDYLKNDGRRCFHCKTELFRIAREEAAKEKIDHIAYGYTASDRSDIRPGHDAAVQAGVVSPLEAAGLGKEEIRQILKENGFDLADKPAAPCLASRVQTGLPVTVQRLRDVEHIENFLRDSGARIVRARIHDDKTIRVETASEFIPTVIAVRSELDQMARERGYRWVVLDLHGYRTGGAA